MSDTFAMCSHKDCINKDNCIRYKDISSPYYCLINYKQICNDNNSYQWIVKKDENIDIKKLNDIPKVEKINTDSTENEIVGENTNNETNTTQDIQQEESKDKTNDTNGW